MSLPAALEELVEQLRTWRDTELAAQQDVEDAEYLANKARAALVHVKGEVKAAADAVDDAIIEYTSPLEVVFIADED